MYSIVEILSEKDPFIATGATTIEQIEEAEKLLGLTFSKEYKEYLSVFGAVSYYGHELTGICRNESLNVVNVTLQMRKYFSNIPREWYVVEELHIGDIVIWQDEQGKIYEATPWNMKQLCGSLKEYCSEEIFSL